MRKALYACHYRHAMDTQPSLKFLHSASTLNQAKLDAFRRLSTADLIFSLTPGHQSCLKARAMERFLTAIIG